MPRRKRWKALRITSFYIPLQFEDTMNLFEELARRDSLSVSELLHRAITEYVETHYPGQPVPPIDSFFEGGNKAVRLEAKYLSTKISKGLQTVKTLKERKGGGYQPNRLHNDLIKNVIKLARLNRKIRSEEYDELIDQGEKELE